MNINGIKLLRKQGLNGAPKEIFYTLPNEVNLEWLYQGAVSGVTIFGFDPNEELDQIPYLEKDIVKFGIPKENWLSVHNFIAEEMIKKGVRKPVFLTHQSYLPKDIMYSGRIVIERNKDGNGSFIIETGKGLKKPHKEFEIDFRGKWFFHEHRISDYPDKPYIENQQNFPKSLLSKIVRDCSSFPLNSSIDFYITNNKEIYYADMFLLKGQDLSKLN